MEEEYFEIIDEELPVVTEPTERMEQHFAKMGKGVNLDD